MTTPLLTHNVRVKVDVMYDYLDILAGYGWLSSDRVVLFGFLDDGRRLLLLLRLLLQQRLNVTAAAPVRERIATASGFGGRP